MSTLMDEKHFSTILSQRMQRAGFRSANVIVQSAVASAIGDIFSFLLKVVSLHVFGSYSDGLGSCMTKLDGTVDPDSDIDVTLILNVPPLHLCAEGTVTDAALCSHSEHHRVVEYKDGYLNCAIKVKKPNLPITRNRTMPAVDLIAAVPCCSYPPIKLLQTQNIQNGNKTQISDHILEALKAEVFESPRCHAVAASQPGSSGQMRVSTTRLERIVMQNLTTVQCQVFILLKFLIKKVISVQAKGLKTYVAKTLLFYMLDKTLPEDWRSENLIELVRKSLTMLVDMMESSSGDNTCMTHFFLLDAAVYLKDDHSEKRDIIRVINETIQNLPNHVTEFDENLCNMEVNVVHFHQYLYFWLIAEYIASPDEASRVNVPNLLWKASDAILKDVKGVPQDVHLESLLQQINQLPDSHRVTKECLKVMAYTRVGKPVADAADEFEFSVSRGIYCLADDSGNSLESFSEAKESVLQILKEVRLLGLEISNGQICKCSLEDEFFGAAQIMKAWSNGIVLSRLNIASIILATSPAMIKYLTSPEHNHRMSSNRLTIAFARFSRFLQRVNAGGRTEVKEPAENPDDRQNWLMSNLVEESLD